MVKRFLGWDCANKSLAWSYFDIDVHIYSKMSMLCDEAVNIVKKYNEQNGSTGIKAAMSHPGFLDEFTELLNIMNHFLDNFIKYHSAGAVDVLNGRKVSDCDEIERTASLHKFLVNNPYISTPNIMLMDGDGTSTDVIIEHQPSKVGNKTNNKSTMVGHQLMFYYAENNPAIVNPKLKNKIYFKEALEYEAFLAEEIPKHKDKKAAVYAARKRHSKMNFLYLVDVFELNHILVGVPKDCMDDLADSTMQVLAYLVENKKFI